MADELNWRWGRAPTLTGAVFVAALIVEGVVGGNSLDERSSGQKVLAWFQAHQGAAEVSAALIVAIVVLGVFFYAMLGDYLRRDPANEPLARVAFAGAVIFGVGGAINEGLTYTAAYAAKTIDPSVARALFEASEASHPVQAAGVAVLAAASALAIVRTGVLPRWLGWVAAVIAVLSLLPGTPGGIGFVAVGLWTLAVSVTMFVRLAPGRSATSSSAPAVPA